MGWTGDACNTGTIVFTLSYKTKYLFKVDNQIIQRKQKKLKEDLKKTISFMFINLHIYFRP